MTTLSPDHLQFFIGNMVSLVIILLALFNASESRELLSASEQQFEMGDIVQTIDSERAQWILDDYNKVLRSQGKDIDRRFGIKKGSRGKIVGVSKKNIGWYRVDFDLVPTLDGYGQRRLPNTILRLS